MRVVLFASLLFVGTAALAQNDLPPPSAADSQPAAPTADAFKQGLSYSLGLDMGRRLQADQVEIDLRAFMAGLQDGVTDAEPKLNQQQIQAIMQQFANQLKQKNQEKEEQMAAAGPDNLAKGEAFLAEYAKKEGVQKTDSGLHYRVLEPGDGASPSPQDTVRVHYEGTLTEGTVFDSSYKRGQPAEFPVGAVIPGWTEALQLMKEGAKWEVVLPSTIAYGASGAGGAIGPNETLVFQIELIKVLD